MEQIDQSTKDTLLGQCLAILSIQTTKEKIKGMLVDITPISITIGKKEIPFSEISLITTGKGKNLCLLYQN